MIQQIGVHHADGKGDGMRRIGPDNRGLCTGWSVLGRMAVFAAIMTSLSLPLRAQEIELRVVDPLRPIYDIESVLEAPRGDELLLVAPRNGAASAQVVVIGAGAGDLRAEMGPLSSGDAELPADAVDIRYAHREDDRVESPHEARSGVDFGYMDAYHDALMPSPQSGSEVNPVWITVQVPAGAASGIYTGELRVGERTVPVRLTVSAWQCPDPADFTTHVGVLASHETLALQYEVEFWSEEHWNLIERQMGYLGKLGADDLWLHANANMGHGRGMALIHFTRDEESIRPDMSVAERYMNLFEEHVGRPSHVILNYWTGRDGEQMMAVVDGERERVPSPGFEGGDEIWRPVMVALHEMVLERGWPEESILIGLSGDQPPRREEVEAFHGYAPYARWAAWSHGRSGHRPVNHYEDGEPIVIEGTGMEIGYYAHPYTPRYSDDLMPHLQGGWNQGKPIYSSLRNYLHRCAAPSQWRNWANGSMVGYREIGYDSHRGAAGFAFAWLDFWPQRELRWVGGHRAEGFIGAPRNERNMNRMNSRSMIEPGADGPVGTVRFEMLREGLQEAEARVVVERALVGGGLEKALVEEARELLTVMFNNRFRDGGFSSGAYQMLGRPEHMWGVAPYPEWMHLTSRLYDLAARVTGYESEWPDSIEFTEAGSHEWDPGEITEVIVIVVAGGGGGGSVTGDRGAGGGGGGGVIIREAYPVSGTVNIVVGAGGAGGVDGSAGEKGEDSSFGTLVAAGGGGGAGSAAGRGGDGGSGGGGAGGGGGLGEPGQGHDGDPGTGRKGGGGGGAGAPGEPGSQSPRRGGDGGEGLYAGYGVNKWFGGGGGGGSRLGSGGSGGGGPLGTQIQDGGGDGRGGRGPNEPGESGAANMGGGGGGGGYNPGNNFSGPNHDEKAKGGDGGSGIVIVIPQ